MAQIRVTQLHDGPRNAVYHVALRGDGSGDLVDETIIDPAAFNPPLPSVPCMKVESLRYDLTGFSAAIEFDYLASDTPVWTMSGFGDPDFCDFGGLADRSIELDGSGKLQLSTSGLGDGDIGTIIVVAKKS